MCMTCGCMEPNDDHGDARNITKADLDRAAQAANVDPAQAAQNIAACCRQMGDACGQMDAIPGQEMGASATAPA